jgi:hypothetical protein
MSFLFQLVGISAIQQLIVAISNISCAGALPLCHVIRFLALTLTNQLF